MTLRTTNADAFGYLRQCGSCCNKIIVYPKINTAIEILSSFLSGAKAESPDVMAWSQYTIF